MDNNDVLIKLQKDFVDQKDKLERADRDFQVAIKSVRKRFVDSDALHFFEKDLNTQELEERDNSALQQLAECVSSFPGEYIFKRNIDG